MSKRKKKGTYEITGQTGVETQEIPLTDVEAQADQAEADVQKTIDEMEAQSTEVPPDGTKEEASKEEKAKKEKKSQMEITRANILKRINELMEKFGFRLEDDRERDAAAGIIYNAVYLLDMEWSKIKQLPEDEKGFVKFAMGVHMNIGDVLVDSKIAFTRRHEAKTKFVGDHPDQQQLPFDRAEDSEPESEPEPEMEEALNFSGEAEAEPAEEELDPIPA